MEVKKIATLKAHSGPLYGLAPGRELGTLFSGGGDRIVAEWNLEHQETNPFGIRTDATIYSLLSINRETLLIGTSQGSMHVIDLKTKSEVRHLKLHEQGIFHLAYNSKSNRVYAACADGTISIWEADQWSLLWHLELTRGKVRRIAFDDDFAHVAFACGDGTVRIHETEKHQLQYTLDAHDESANSVAFLPNGDLLSGGKDAHLCLWHRVDSYQRIEHIPAHNFAIYDIVVDPDGRWIATASRDKTVKVWDSELKELPIRLDRMNAEGHINSVNGLIYLEEEKLLASCSNDRTVCLWAID